MRAPPERVERTLVALRRVALEDEAALFRASRDPEVMRYMDWPMPAEPAETGAHLRKAARWWDEGAEFQFAIEERATGLLVGTIAFRPRVPAADFGYFLAREHWGKGFAHEAASWVVGWLQAQPELLRIWATADAENVRSRALLERLGLRLEEILPRATLRPNLGGPPRDTARYAWNRSQG